MLEVRWSLLVRPYLLQSGSSALRHTLQKHLVHLKLMQQMAEIPRALGFTDNQIQDALAQSVTEGAGGPDAQVLNPFSSMGISDQDYVEMLQGIAMEKEGKRGLEVVRGEGTARFQEGESPGSGLLSYARPAGSRTASRFFGAGVKLREQRGTGSLTLLALAVQ